MTKNIVIFSDGTGQRGGVAFDERRSNIYKLFRATRCGPDSTISPNRQLTYYDPGLGTVPEGSQFLSGLYRRIRNLMSQATGLGITENIIDCYVEIIRIWEPGDRIYVFGFSRGAYTVRCLASVLCFCGVPTRLKDGLPLKRDTKTLRKIAREGVTDIYQHVSSPRDTEYIEQRKALAKRFRDQYGSAEKDGSNAYPHFIGVFDTVASLASYPALALIVTLGLAILASISYLLSLALLSFTTWMLTLNGATTLILALWYLENHLKYAWKLPGYSFCQTLHLTEAKMKFYDKLLNTNVGYARHAIALDEHRESFDRVPWGNKKEESRKTGKGNPIWFKQLWFAGNHSDIGGSYPENESRLSDIALKWMVEEAKNVPGGLITDKSVLRLFPSYKGMQHDESRTGVFRYSRKIDRQPVPNATLHESVFKRFALKEVLHLDELKAYRPLGLQSHEKLITFYITNEKNMTA